MHFSALLTLLPLTLAAPLINVRRQDAIAGKYIVKYKGDMSTLAEDEIKSNLKDKPDFEYSLPGFRGFAGSLSDAELAQLKSSNAVCLSRSPH